VSVTEFDLDLLSLQFAVRRRFALFLLVSCAVAAFPVWLGRGQRISKQLQLQQNYLSTGKLLLRPSSQKITYLGSKVDINPLRNRTNQMWFQDFDSVRKILTEEKFLKKVLARTPASAGLNVEMLKTKIFAYPSSLNTETLSELFEMNAQEISGRSQEGGVEEFQESESEVNKRFSLQLITITVSGSSPEESEQLAKSVIDEFLKETRRQSAQEYSRKCKTLEELRDRASQQLAKVSLLLKQNAGGISPEQRLDLQVSLGRQLNSLQGRLAGLQGELAARLPDTQLVKKKRQGPGVAKAGVDAAVENKVTALRARLLAEQAIYQPDSQTIRTTESLLQNLEQLQLDSTQKRDAIQDLKYAIFEKAAKAEIARLQSEILDIVQVLGDPKENYEASKLRRTQDYWENAAMAIGPQLYQARLEERQALARGSLVVIQKPFLGFSSSAARQVTPWTVGFVAFLPIAGFVGVTLCLLVDQFHRRRKLEYQLSRLHLPVWGRVATLPSATSQSWNEVKFRSSNQ
jgi:hypothetical protein